MKKDTQITENANSRRIAFYPAMRGIPDITHFGKYENLKAERPLGMHTHRGCMEICYLYRGRQLFQAENKSYQMSGGDIFVTFPDEKHSSGLEPMEKGCLFWFGLKINNNSKLFLGTDHSRAKMLQAKLLNLPQRHFKATRQIKAIFDRIIDIWMNEKDLLKLRMNSNILELLCMIVNLSNRSSKKISEKIQKTQEHIRQNITNPIKLDDLAKLSGLSISRFKNRFREETGIPPREYIIREKIERSKILIKDQHRDITTIAFDLGFSTSQYFSTVFRRITGMRPVDYRRTILTSKKQMD